MPRPRFNDADVWARFKRYQRGNETNAEALERLLEHATVG